MDNKLPINETATIICRPDERQASAAKLPSKTDKSRTAILNGWIISMLGIVLYCLAMLGDSVADPFSSILERGWAGGATISLLAIGVLLWLYGAVTFLQEVEHDSPDDWGSTF